MSRETAVAVCLTAVAACTSPAPPSPPARTPVSGIDFAAFDKAVRPQDDLFQHVNGSWLNKTGIPADKSSYGAFDMLFDKAQADLKAIVEEAGKSTTKTPGSEAQKIGDFWRHRRGDRPRDGPRLRRPGPEVRRDRRPARLVDEAG